MIEEILYELVNSIMDAVEEFFEAMVVPTVKFTRDAFLVSLVFLGWGIIAKLFSLPTCITWNEALACSVMMGALVLIDNSSRSAIKENLNKIRQMTQNSAMPSEEGDIEDE